MRNTQEDFEFTSESVSEGHPDKVCDQISDSILDLFMEKDSNSRVACETLATTNRIVLAGEINLKNKKNEIGASLIDEVVRKKVKEIGYEQDGFHWKNLKIENLLHNQSTDISQGVDKDESNELYGAGDQGIMFGYACDETKSLMPAPIDYSHKILKTLSDYRHNNDSFFGPDSKSQVSVLYKNNRPQNISSIVVSSQHLESANNNEIRKKILEIIEKAIPKITLPSEKKILINPTGRFVIGGPDGDAGLTGRKIIVDTYGGAAPHGGGAFSGKDYTKVDRSAAYMARYIAKNIVAANLAERCEVQLAYCIGVAHPMSVNINTFDTSSISNVSFINLINKVFDLRPAAIIDTLDLKNPIYRRFAAYGHFGRENNCSWEKIDMIDQLKNNLGEICQ